MSCKAGYYLDLTDGSQTVGTCVAKSSDTITVDVFVQPEAESTADADGTYSKPFGHLYKALKYVEDNSAEYDQATVNIHLLAGEHYMERDWQAYDYEYSKMDKYSISQDVTISPAFCGQTIAGHTFGETDND